ncbi:MAG TPA: hypothetical protein VHF89_06415 [Solirubrobacteraceae bacterium]|nr:hypothetical protein [Solirubrobacteraceae bacterium]
MIARTALPLLVATVALTACGSSADQASTTPTTPKPATTAAPASPQRFTGDAADVAAAVAGLSRAIDEGDVLALCRPGAIFTRGVIAERRQEEPDCESWVEQQLAAGRLAAPTLTAVSLKPDLAVARLGVRGGTVPLTLLRAGGGWLISFSGNVDPLQALLA